MRCNGCILHVRETCRGRGRPSLVEILVNLCQPLRYLKVLHAQSGSRNHSTSDISFCPVSEPAWALPALVPVIQPVLQSSKEIWEGKPVKPEKVPLWWDVMV